MNVQVVCAFGRERPHNVIIGRVPDGVMMEFYDNEALAGWLLHCRKHGLRLVSVTAYEEAINDGRRTLTAGRAPVRFR
jgi:hypothetical protein